MNSTPSAPVNNDIIFESAIKSLLEDPNSITNAKKVKELLEDDSFQDYLISLGAKKVSNLILIFCHFIPEVQSEK